MNLFFPFMYLLLAGLTTGNAYANKCGPWVKVPVDGRRSAVISGVEKGMSATVNNLATTLLIPHRGIPDLYDIPLGNDDLFESKIDQIASDGIRFDYLCAADLDDIDQKFSSKRKLDEAQEKLSQFKSKILGYNLSNELEGKIFSLETIDNLNVFFKSPVMIALESVESIEKDVNEYLSLKLKVKELRVKYSTQFIKKYTDVYSAFVGGHFKIGYEILRRTKQVTNTFSFVDKQTNQVHFLEMSYTGGPDRVNESMSSFSGYEMGETPEGERAIRAIKFGRSDAFIGFVQDDDCKFNFVDESARFSSTQGSFRYNCYTRE